MTGWLNFSRAHWGPWCVVGCAPEAQGRPSKPCSSLWYAYSAPKSNSFTSSCKKSFDHQLGYSYLPLAKCMSMSNAAPIPCEHGTVMSAHVESELTDAVQDRAQGCSRLVTAAVGCSKVHHLRHHCAVPQRHMHLRSISSALSGSLIQCIAPESQLRACTIKNSKHLENKL